MKSLKNLRNSLFLGCLALGTLGLLGPDLASAEGKGASKLMFTSTGALTHSQSAQSNPAGMSCAQCKDAYVKVLDTSAKGMRAGAQKNVAVHLCASCQTRIASAGSGKTQVAKVAHTCGSNGSAQAGCCVAAK